MNVKYVIFDYGGTLDTGGRHWADLIFRTYHEHGLDVTAKDFKKAYIATERYLGCRQVIQPSDSFRQTLSLKIRLQLQWFYDHKSVKSGIPEQKELHKAIVDELYQLARHNTRLARNVITALKSAGLHTALVSNFYGNIRTVLQEMGLSDLFEHVIESAEVGIRKPDPRIYALAAERLSVSDADRNKVVVVGDSPEKDIAPAGSLGFNTVWICPRNDGNTSLFRNKRSDMTGSAPTIRIYDIQQLLLHIKDCQQ